MIPRVAFFYWTGGPLPWLRAQSLESFRRLHPDWRVVLGSPEQRGAPPGVELELDRVTDPGLPPAARSDSWRWHVLAERGGLYADTDVVFTRNVEPLFTGDHEAWLTLDLGTPAGVERLVWEPVPGGQRPRRRRDHKLSIGVLGAQPGSRFFSRAAEVARATPPSSAPRDYQRHGTGLLAEHWSRLESGARLGNLPGRAFYRHGSSPEEVRRTWHEAGEPVADEFGVHWYGGSPESVPFLGASSAAELPGGLVRQAIEAGERALDCGTRGGA